ncbi:Aste57867_9277 [Aphanomyces stellatus]|uniref:Aste57867_9277 protein n=1 Tax=Aphanomyces stellatus TaxID=120398 RepID=A0A485KMM1_9STRA|nr:hypothetical protein As57867_009241 [Aphanomyces stellatus]VFT86160.1 Aste57867_9277 [Aphanomyces stellatus]
MNKDSPITIGRPIANVNSYVLCEEMRIVPVGVIGEMYLGGICVSPGYINLTDQTSERFLTDSFSPARGEMFRTGDLARLLPNGQFEILGRQDSQVKLKGYRIELDEVANAIQCHPQVVAAAAVVKNKSLLVGFFTPSNINISELQDVVASQLPGYMVPSVWTGLDEMPQNANGKIDKKALESLDVIVTTEDLETDNEKRMAAVWAQVLNVDVAEIGRQTSFFALGGDSLSVIKVVAVCKELGMEVSTAQLLKELVLWKVAASVSDRVSITTWPRVSLPQEVVESITNQYAGANINVHDCVVYPVTPLQAGMVYATVSNPSSYLMQMPIQMKQWSDVEKLCAAFQQIAQTRDILRTTFVTSTTGIYQIIHSSMNEFKVAHVLTDDIDEFLRKDYTRGFEIGDNYFVRLSSVSTTNEQFAVLTIHHALYDGWTIPMLMSDLCDAMSGNTLVHRPSFCDVVDYIQAQDKESTEAFWRAYLLDLKPTVVGTHQCIHDRNEHADNTFSMVAHMTMEEITQAARRVNLTIAEVIKLAWAATLRKYTRRNDVVFGYVTANRNIPVRDVEMILGPLLSTIPCRVKFDDSLSANQWIDAIYSERGALITHSHASLIDMKRWSGVEGDFFDTLFVFQNMPTDDASSGVFDVMQRENDSRFDTGHAMDVMVVSKDNSLILQATYDPKRIESEKGKWMLHELDHSISQLIQVLVSDAPLSTLYELSPKQMDEIQSACFGPSVGLKNELLHHAFEEFAIRNPDLGAIEFEDKYLTYGELNDRANTLAFELATMGVCVGSRVAVVMDRCLEFPIGLLATLKVGASMMPLDSSFPSMRLRQMVVDANAAVILTTSNISNSVLNLSSETPVIIVQSDYYACDPKVFAPSQCHLAQASHEAYVVYTSGSTGTPKGVSILHDAAINAVSSPFGGFDVLQNMRVMQFRAIGSDVFQWEMWKTLSSGACLVFRGEDPLVTLHKVDLLSCTPTALAMFGHPSQYPNLKCIAVGGEVLPESLKNLWCDDVVLINCYGPSECTIRTHEVQMARNRPVTIGKPNKNTSCYVLDQEQRIVPLGVLGDIALGGICVSPGYFNLPDLTQSRFVNDPFARLGFSPKMYLTGDIGRLNANGDFEVLGREDSQVKLKGYRIELDEVASAIMSHPCVKTAAVIVKNGTHLVGYFAPANVHTAELQDFVANVLPVYMVPAAWVGLNEMPQNLSGKIDKMALESLNVALDWEDLQTENETRMAAVWSDVLDVDMAEIGRKSSFFAFGGDSISSVKVVAKCRNIGLIISVAQLVRARTLEVAAAIATTKELTQYPHVELRRDIVEAIAARVPQPNEECVIYPVTPMQRYMLKKTTEDPQAWQLQTVLLMGDDMDASALCQAFKTVVECNELLRSSFTMLNDSFYQVIPRKSTNVHVATRFVSHVDEYLTLDWARGFYVGDTDWIRFAIVTESSNQRHAVLTIHHALYDGWASSMITGDILNIYQNQPQIIRPPFRRVIEYIEATKSAQRNFWTTYLDGVSDTTHLNWPNSTDINLQTDDNIFLQSKVSKADLTKCSNEMEVPMSTLLQFAWASTLRKYSQQKVVVFGQILANRSVPVNDADRIIGPLINFVPCRVVFDDDLTIKTLLQRFQVDSSAVLAHSFVDLDDIKSWCGLDKALTETRFSFQNFPVDSNCDVGDSTRAFEPVYLEGRTHSREEAFSFIIEVAPTSCTDMHLCCTYDPEIFTHSQAQEILATYNAAIESLMALDK